MKFVLHLTSPGQTDVVQIAYSDPRRLGRIRLRADPVNEPPLSLLGPDPIVSPPTREDWLAAVTKRRSPIKSVLLDQTVCV
jgi:formamidopyrimidine-DNA glycosylase